MNLKKGLLYPWVLIPALFLLSAAAWGSDASPADPASYAQILQQAQAYEDGGDPAKAYALLKPLEMAHAGEVGFDYLLGISALDSGHPARATLIFERVLAVDPGNAAARLDMARAYYQLGDFSRARTEFQAVLTQNISRDARAVIERYLDAMDDRASGSRTLWHGHLDLNAGHDTNVNAATSQSQIVVDSLNYAPLALSPDNLARPDSYHGFAAGGDVQHALDAHWLLDGGLEWARRVYDDQYLFNTEALGGHGGVSYVLHKERLHFGLGQTRNNLGGIHNYDISNATLDWRHAFSPANMAGLFLLRSNYRYKRSGMEKYDFNQSVAGVAGQHVMAGGRVTLTGSLFHGREEDISTIVTLSTPDGGRPDGPRHFNGIRAGVFAAADGNVVLFAGAGVQVSHYSRTNVLFLRQRDERYTNVTAGLNWNFARRWTLRPQYSFYHNVSNIPIYQYLRRDFSLTLRRDFQ